MLLIPDADTALMDPFTQDPDAVAHLQRRRSDHASEPYSRDPRNIARKAEQLPEVDRHRRHRLLRPRGRVLHLRRRPLRLRSRTRRSIYIDSVEGRWNIGPRRGAEPRLQAARTRAATSRSRRPTAASTCAPRWCMTLAGGRHRRRDAAPRGRHRRAVRDRHALRAAARRWPTTLMWFKYIVKNVARKQRQDGDVHAEAALRRQRLGHALPPVAVEGREAAVRRRRLRGPDARWRSTTSAASSSTRASLCAFTNPTTNCYRRLVPGFEAPVNLAYSARNRSASIRIPMYSASPKAKRLEFRTPDPSCNPYLAFAAMMMAGLDGIEKRIHPGEPLDKDIYALSPEELKEVPSVPGSLDEALKALREGPRLPAQGRRVHARPASTRWIDDEARATRSIPSGCARSRSSSRSTTTADRRSIAATEEAEPKRSASFFCARRNA